MVITLNKIIEVFENIADKHMMIHQFGFGASYNMVNMIDKKYPFLYVEPDASNIDIENNNMIGRYTFNLFVMDKITKGDDNYNDLLSDTDFILNNIIAEFLGCPFYRENMIKLDGTITTKPLFEETDDNLNGWVGSFILKFPIGYSNCSIPVNGPCE